MKLTPDKKIFEFNLNWALISSFAAFWCYGYYGAVSFKNLGFIANLIISVILYGVFLSLLLLSRYHKDQYSDTLTVRAKDIVVLLSFSAIIVGLSLHELTSSLAGDQYAHAQESQRHFITVLLKISALTSTLDGAVFSNVLYVLNLLSISALAALYFIFRNRSFTTKVIVLSAGFFIFRVAIILLGSYATPHPPLRLFPLWLSSSLLSSTNFSFRLPQILGLVGVMWLAQRIANRKLTFVCSWLFGLAVGTIPLLWHVGTLVEQSVWTAVIWSVMLLSLADIDDVREFKWVRWFSLVFLFTMMRQPVFLALMPLGILYFFGVFIRNGRDLKKLLFAAAPVLLILPFVVKSLAVGTPANYIPGESSFMPAAASGLERVWIAVRSGVAPWIIFKTVMWPWAIFPVFVFLFSVEPKRVANTIVTILFFAAAFATFFTIRTGLWGIDRYQAEYVIPFAILGLYILLVKLNGIGNKAPKFLAACLICLVAYNIYVFKGQYSPYKEKQLYKGVEIQSESIYNYKDALKAVRNAGYAGSAYMAGITYGIFPEILNHYMVGEVLLTKKMQDRQNELARQGGGGGIGLSAESINASPSIKIVLISDLDQGAEELLQGLRESGWESWKNFTDERSGTVIYGMARGGR